MTRHCTIFGLLVLFLSSGFAAEVSGKWSGTIAVKDELTGTVITTPVQIHISQQSTTISGDIGRAEDSDLIPIKNGRLNGNTIYFEATSEETSGPCKFTLTVTGDNMEGDMTGAIDDNGITGKVKLTRSRS